MIQDDKQLLLKDLSARQPHGVHCCVFNLNKTIKEDNDVICGIVGDNIVTLKSGKNECYMYYQIKPYLRTMDSMTEEEKIKLYQIAGFYYLSNNELLKDEWRQFSDALSENKLFLPYPIWEDDLNKVYDWLNANHFDYRGLIPMGLAIEVTKENNPYKE